MHDAYLRRIGFAPLLVILAACTASAEPWASKLFNDATTHDFGTVPRGAQLLHRFTMTNVYAVPLEITQVRASCGCAQATPSAKVLQPRETCTVDVSMDAAKFTGQKTVTVHITVGPTYISTAELRVSATTRNDVVYNPGQVNFGAVAGGGTPSQTIDIEYAGSLDWQITEVLSKDQPFEVSLKELYRRKGEGVGYQLKVTLKSDAPPGALKRELHLRTNDPTSPLIGVLVEGTVESVLSVSPSPLRLGQVKAGEMLTRKILVRGQKPFRIVSVDGLGDGLSLNGDLPASAALIHTLALKYEPGKPGDFQKQLTIRTDLGTASVSLSVDATVAP